MYWKSVWTRESVFCCNQYLASERLWSNIFKVTFFWWIICLPIHLSKGKVTIIYSRLSSQTIPITTKNTWERLGHSMYYRSCTEEDRNWTTCPRLHRKPVITESRLGCNAFFYIVSPLANSLRDRMTSSGTQPTFCLSRLPELTSCRNQYTSWETKCSRDLYFFQLRESWN